MNRQTEYDRKIQELFNRWKHKKPSEDGSIDHFHRVFISDGVVSPNEWFHQELRPLFLLKEAYGGDYDWDLIQDQLLRSDQHMSLIWKNVTKWTEGLFNTTKDTILEYSDSCPEYYGNDWLRKIAVVNVKKSGGEKQSDMTDIEAYADYDKEQLLDEITICDPTLIVCGYTIGPLNIITGQMIKDYKEPDDNWIYSFELNGHRVIVIDYYHPANQYPRLMNYYSITHLYQLALQRYQ